PSETHIRPDAPSCSRPQRNRHAANDAGDAPSSTSPATLPLRNGSVGPHAYSSGMFSRVNPTAFGSPVRSSIPTRIARMVLPSGRGANVNVWLERSPLFTKPPPPEPPNEKDVVPPPPVFEADTDGWISPSLSSRTAE